jgi:hypothetical protein
MRRPSSVRLAWPLVAIVVFGAPLASCSSGFERSAAELSPRVPSPSVSHPSSAPPSAEPSSSATSGEPAIVVETPQASDEVGSPIRIEGTANVFEATVSIELLDASGQVLAATFATATCGTGCRGAFSAKLFFFTSERQNGLLRLFESSAQDGSELHVIEIPLALVPGT